MKICKYCKKPISDNNIWNPDSKGNGYHHACLCEMEFRSRDNNMYNKGRADVLDKIRAEIASMPKTYPFVDHIYSYVKVSDVIKIIDKYKSESEE